MRICCFHEKARPKDGRAESLIWLSWIVCQERLSGKKPVLTFARVKFLFAQRRKVCYLESLRLCVIFWRFATLVDILKTSLVLQPFQRFAGAQRGQRRGLDKIDHRLRIGLGVFA